MSIKRYMPHRVLWEKKNEGGNDYTGQSYAPPVELPAYKKIAARQSQGTGGTEDRSIDEIHIPLGYDVKIGDKIDGVIVQALVSIDDHRGRRDGYKLYTERPA